MSQVKENAGGKKFFSIGNVTVAAILTAISFLMYNYLKFNLPFMFPGFLEMQFSDLPALLGGFALGPGWGCIIILIRCLLKMPFTHTACVGEIGDLVVGIAFVLPAALIYKYNRSRKGALLGLGIGTVAAILMALLANRVILIPFYVGAMGGMDTILGMVSALYPEATAETFYNYYLPLAVLPFNALRCILCGVLTFLVYKPLSRALHWEYVPKKKTAAATTPEAATETAAETPVVTSDEAVQPAADDADK